MKTMTEREWIERAREVFRGVVDRSWITIEEHRLMRALLAEPVEPEYGPGDKIPGWYAYRYACEGRKDEAEWRMSHHDHWTSLSSFAAWNSVVEDDDCIILFRLRPAPEPPPEPEPIPNPDFIPHHKVQMPDGSWVQGPGRRSEPAPPQPVCQECHGTKKVLVCGAENEWFPIPCSHCQHATPPPKPAPTQPELCGACDGKGYRPSGAEYPLPCPVCAAPAPREAFEEAINTAMEAICQTGITPEVALLAEMILSALRALADDHARRALDTAARYDRLVERYCALAEEVRAR